MINNAITLDFIDKWRLIKYQDLNLYKEYPDFIRLLGFSSDPESMNTYKVFLEKSMSFIRAINRSIVDDGIEQNNKEKVYFKIMSAELFKEIQHGNDIQIIHFISFWNDETIRDKFYDNQCISDILVEVIVPIDCYNACSYEEPSNEKAGL